MNGPMATTSTISSPRTVARPTRFWAVGLSGSKLAADPETHGDPVYPVPRVHLGYFTNPDGCWDVPAQVQRLLHVWDRSGDEGRGLELHFPLAHLFPRPDAVGAPLDLIVSQFAAGRLAIDRPHPLTGKTDAEMLRPLADVLATRPPLMTWIDTEGLSGLETWALWADTIEAIIGTPACQRAMPRAAWQIDPSLVDADYFALGPVQQGEVRVWREAFNAYAKGMAIRGLGDLLRSIGALGVFGTYGSWTGTDNVRIAQFPGNGSVFSIPSIDGDSASTYLGNWLPSPIPETADILLAAVAADVRDTSALVSRYGDRVAVKVDVAADARVVHHAVAQAVAQGVGHVLFWDDTAKPADVSRWGMMRHIARNEQGRWIDSIENGTVRVGRSLRFVKNGNTVDIEQG